MGGNKWSRSKLFYLFQFSHLHSSFDTKDPMCVADNDKIRLNRLELLINYWSSNSRLHEMVNWRPGCDGSHTILILQVKLWKRGSVLLNQITFRPNNNNKNISHFVLQKKLIITSGSDFLIRTPNLLQKYVTIRAHLQKLLFLNISINKRSIRKDTVSKNTLLCSQIVIDFCSDALDFDVQLLVLMCKTKTKKK